MDHPQADVLARREGATGHITLNHPRAIHALTRGMSDAISATLIAWREDPQVQAVLIDHAPGTRGFCAGGDVLSVRRSVLEDGGVFARAFFMAEYRLNHLLYTYPKPVVTFMDGVTMGGGVGIALPARLRVATENTLLAMPEGSIGLFPDVGAGLYLSRLPGQLGKFLALTGARLDGAECVWAGLATHYLEAENLAEAKTLIAAEPMAAGDILSDLASPTPPARLAGNAARINRLFAPDALEGILAALKAEPSDWASKEWKAVTSRCPTSAKVALRLLALAPSLPDFAAEMELEYRLACHLIARPDFVEGVRAVLVDKDNSPRWQPAKPEAVDEATLDAVFAPLSDDGCWTPFPTGN